MRYWEVWAEGLFPVRYYAAPSLRVALSSTSCFWAM